MLCYSNSFFETFLKAHGRRVSINNIFNFLFSPWKKKEYPRKVMREKGSLSVCRSVCLSVYLSVCLSVSEESCVVYVWKKLNLTWCTILNLYFRWINKGRKDSYQNGTSLTRVHTCFLINLRTSKLLTKQKPK